jgi:hypothetical protein
MRKFLLIIASFFFLWTLADAQLPSPRKYKIPTSEARRLYQLKAEYNRMWKLKRYELSFGIGSTQFFGDLGGFSRTDNLLGLKDFRLRSTGFNANTSLKYRLLRSFSARVNLASGFFHSTDVGGINENRGFASSTLFFEPTIIGDYHFIKPAGRPSSLFMRSRRNFLRTFFATNDFYLFAGYGGLLYSVRPNDLLSAAETKRRGFTAVIPAGLGINMIYNKFFNFGLELGGRYTFSDYIDGYTSQYSKSNDIYYFLNINIIYKLKTGKNGLPAF